MDRYGVPADQQMDTWVGELYVMDQTDTFGAEQQGAAKAAQNMQAAEEEQVPSMHPRIEKVRVLQLPQKMSMCPCRLFGPGLCATYTIGLSCEGGLRTFTLY